MGVKRIAPGSVLYNGEQPLNVRGVCILNPLNEKNIWRTLTATAE